MFLHTTRGNASQERWLGIYRGHDRGRQSVASQLHAGHVHVHVTVVTVFKLGHPFHTSLSSVHLSYKRYYNTTTFYCNTEDLRNFQMIDDG
jgi:hypothetical protein